MKARDLLYNDEAAIVIFTDGRNFHIDADRNGSTGNWRVNPNRQFDKVIIYNRDTETKTNDVYLAIPTGITKSPDKGRYVIGLASISHVGTTGENWIEFAEGGQNPIRYLNSNG